MSSQSRSLPERPSLRFLKLEARERLAAGEFATLHEAQLAIAREHGQPSWAALKRLVESRPAPGSPAPNGHALDQVRWVLTRFAGADGPGWTAPAEDELAEHLEPRFLEQVPPLLISEALSRRAGLLRGELAVLDDAPLAVRARTGGVQIEATATAEPPHRLTMLRVFPVGDLVTDDRVTAPPVQVAGEVPAAVAEVAETAFGELGLAGLVLAGTGLAGTGPTGGPDWVVSRGWADLDRAEALRPGHRFPVWSVAKLVTAIAVLRLVADGRVGLDEPANRYLGSVRLASEAVTVRELLAHTGGVDSPKLFADRVPELADLTGPVMACPGERGTFRYSSGGYAALGALVGEVTGMAYADAATRLVLAPLGMTGASFPDRAPGQDGEDGEDAVTGYLLDAEGGSFRPVPARASVCTMPAAGGLWATAGDLVRLGAGWRSLLPGELACEAVTPQVSRAPMEGQMGLGWILNTDREVAGHFSAGPGGSASLITRGGAGGLVAVAVTSRTVPIEPVAARVIRAMA
jgi:CubicO group peptidase (beta-lactamase class C family)